MADIKHVIVQVGYAVYGAGASEQDAYDDARQWTSELPPLDQISRYVGSAPTGDNGPRGTSGRKSMTQHGEMHTGEMVLMDADEARAQGYEIPTL